MTAPEFSRPVRIDSLGVEPRILEIAAGPDERVALARRFGLLVLDRLEARFSLARKGSEILARGRVEAELSQACVATFEPVPARVEETFEIHFRPPPQGARADEEVELDSGDLDIVFYDGGAIDIGEAAAETLALALDPYPRSPGAADRLKEMGVVSEEEAGPFGALAALRDKLKKP